LIVIQLDLTSVEKVREVKIKSCGLGALYDCNGLLLRPSKRVELIGYILESNPLKKSRAKFCGPFYAIDVQKSMSITICYNRLNYTMDASL